MKHIGARMRTREPRKCDARITVADNTVIVEYIGQYDLVLRKSSPQAQQLLNNIKLTRYEDRRSV